MENYAVTVAVEAAQHSKSRAALVEKTETTGFPV